MAESMLDSANSENKTGEFSASDRFEASISFGRFDNDALSWEKWSSFSHNKYLEEVEKCSTPGSVARKKAYFEAHYKNFAARKLEPLDQEKQMGTDHSGSCESNSEDLVNTDKNIDVSHSQSYSEDVTNLTGVNDTVSSESKRSPVEVVKEEVNDGINSLKLSNTEEAAVVKEETHFMGSDKLENETVQSSVNMVENGTLNESKESHKVTQDHEEEDLPRTKKKPVSSVTKSPQFSSPRPSKPELNSSGTSIVSRPSIKNGNSSSVSKKRYLSAGESVKNGTGSSLSKKKTSSAGEIKRVIPESLHGSISLNPSKSDPSSAATTRKSLFMEKMGDKDIVKRAFKSFHSYQSATNGESISSPSEQVLMKRTENRSSTSLNLRTENGGKKVTEKRNPQQGQMRGSMKPVKSRSPVPSSVDQRKAKVAPSSLSLRRDDQAVKGKKFSRKVEEKPKAKEVEGTRTRIKPKEEKEADIRKVRHSRNIKATPLQTSYMGGAKSRLDKNGAKNENNFSSQSRI